jgi:hypothetical protein
MEEEKKKIGREAFELGLSFLKSEEDEEVVDIIEFATSPKFCGKELYPEQELILKLIFKLPLSERDMEILDYWMKQGYVPEDVLERGKGLEYFNEIVFVIGRRGSKTFLSSLIATYMIYRLIKLGNPQKFFGIQEDKEIFFYCIARSGIQTKNTIYSDIKNMILSCVWLHDWIYPKEGVTATEIRIMTPADKLRYEEIMTRGISTTSPIASIRVVSMHSSSSSLRGPAVFMAIYTEFAYFLDSSGNMSSAAVYEAVDPSVKTFGKWGIQILDSTPWSQTGKFYERYMLSRGLDPAGNPIEEKSTYNGIISFHMPSWEMYRFSRLVDKKPIITFDEIKDKAITNPDTFWIEWGAQFGKTVDAYFDPELVDECFDPRLKVVDIGVPKYIYKFHCDPSESGANFGIVGGHLEKIGDSMWKYEFEPHLWDRYLVVIDYVKAYKPSDFKDGKIDYLQIENEITELAMRFNVDEISFDQWNSVASIQHIKENLRKRGRTVKVHKINFTQKSNFDRYENLKSAMLQGLVKIPKGPEGSDEHYLMLELKFLQKKNNRVDRQNAGVVKTKDLADCLGQVVWNLLGDIRDGQSFPRAVHGIHRDDTSFMGYTTFEEYYRSRL